MLCYNYSSQCGINYIFIRCVWGASITIAILYNYTIFVRRSMACVCMSVLTLSPCFEAHAEKPRCMCYVGNGRAESTWTTIANSLDVQLCGNAKQDKIEQFTWKDHMHVYAK